MSEEMSLSSVLAVSGLLLDLAGAAILATGLFISKKRAIELSVSRFAGQTRAENLRLPAVQDRLKQSRRALVGVTMLICGFGLQIASYLVPRPRVPLQMVDLLRLLDSLLVLGLVGITIWYATSTAKMQREMMRQSRITAIGAEMAARAALAQIPLEEGKSKRRLEELAAEMKQLTES